MTAKSTPIVEFRPLAEVDFPTLYRWLAEPHVRAFYQKTPTTLAEVIAKHGPRVRGEVPTIAHLAIEGGAPFGYIQSYYNRDWPDWARMIGRHDGISVDLHIGEVACLGRGLGQAMLSEYLRAVAFKHFSGAAAAYIAHDIANAAALRCSLAVGFRPLGTFVEDGATMRLLRLQRGSATVDGDDGAAQRPW